MNTIPARIRLAVSEEMERRLDEAETYLEITQQDRQEEEDELAGVIADVIRSQVADATDTEAIAADTAHAATDAILARVQGCRRRAVEKAVYAAVEGLVQRRLDAAQKYLRLLESARAAQEHQMPWMLSELFRQRLDACEDWVTLDLTDWARLRTILLPERADTTGFRRYSKEALSLWGKLCRTVLPESYCDPATVPTGTDSLPGTWEKVDVMAFRESTGVQLRSTADAILAEDAGMIAPQSLADESGYQGNGRKNARTINGERVDKDVVQLQGCPLRAPTPEEEWQDEDWWKLRPPTGQPPVVSTVEPEAPVKPTRRRKSVDTEPLLPFSAVG